MFVSLSRDDNFIQSVAFFFLQERKCNVVFQLCRFLELRSGPEVCIRKSWKLNPWTQIQYFMLNN